MDIKPTDKKDKLIIFFDEIKSGSVESAVKDLCKINIEDREYERKKRNQAGSVSPQPEVFLAVCVSCVCRKNGAFCPVFLILVYKYALFPLKQ
ncbi:MAG: hypothetical protein K6B45_02215 [Bacteroidaceae bacterium]|nr:hypothetical protein [Bacteroidaceae bacterium]